MRSLLLTVLVVAVFGAAYGCRLNTRFRPPPEPPKDPNCIFICVNFTNNLTATELEAAENPRPEDPKYKLCFKIFDPKTCQTTRICITVGYFTSNQCFKLNVKFMVATDQPFGVSVRCEQRCKFGPGGFRITNLQKLSAMVIPEPTIPVCAADLSPPECPSVSTVDDLTQTPVIGFPGWFKSVGSTNVTTVSGVFKAQVQCHLRLKTLTRDQSIWLRWSVKPHCTETRTNLCLIIQDRTLKAKYKSWCFLRLRFSVHSHIKKP